MSPDSPQRTETAQMMVITKTEEPAQMTVMAQMEIMAQTEETAQTAEAPPEKQPAEQLPLCL